MARPIKETPTLYGADARRFEKLITNPKPASREEKERIKQTYEAFKAIATFPMLLTSYSMNELTQHGICAHQQVSQSKSCGRGLKPSYFKLRNGSNTAPRLNTRIVELKGVEFDHLKTNILNFDK